MQDLLADAMTWLPEPMLHISPMLRALITARPGLAPHLLGCLTTITSESLDASGKEMMSAICQLLEASLEKMADCWSGNAASRFLGLCSCTSCLGPQQPLHTSPSSELEMSWTDIPQAQHLAAVDLPDGIDALSMAMQLLDDMLLHQPQVLSQYCLQVACSRSFPALGCNGMPLFDITAIHKSLDIQPPRQARPLNLFTICRC